ncbi:hypothetical protein [Glycomyces terrestris]|uniref:Uncharacterized protein n=1 Tax=Glycomyces terrestris TaxID=2493553 RepID=A0A426UXP2_9ACTN|nr:hypothetical protein [Glycomyces terrestris]RRR99367.1 hypothetical protein EIW28_11675 [Glycomyces terrestris]
MRVLALAALLLAVLAHGIAAGLGTGAPHGFSGADCFHVDAAGGIGDCRDAPAPAPTAAVAAANWTWWGPAAAPVALGLLALCLWRRLRTRSAAS